MYEKNISIKDLAHDTGINASTISSFLAGSRAVSNENLDKILQVLELTLVPKAKFVFKREIPSDVQTSGV